jgi:hypothetical protein
LTIDVLRKKSNSFLGLGALLDLRGGATVKISRYRGWRIGLFFFVLMECPPGQHAFSAPGRPDLRLVCILHVRM